MVTDTDSLSEIALNDSIDEKGSCIEVCEDSSLDSNIVILKCPENDNDINSLSQYSDTEDQNGTCADMRVDSNKDGEVGANKSLRLENSTEEQLQHVTSEDETIKSDKNNISSGDMHIDSNKDGEIAANMSLKLENIKRKAGAEIVSKKIKKNKMKNDDGERIQKENAIQNYKIQNAKCSMVDSSRKGIKRLSSDVIGNLPDARMKVFKNPESQKLPSRLMPRSLLRKNKINVKQDFISLSSYGSTSNFYVSNIQKIKKANMNSEVQSFRQKMLNRNPRQPISHYTMFLEKQKASNNHYPSDKSY
ncbi:uncharacterized protein LOC144469961 [Augochlora pura]